jgi:hypothetical protein
LPWVHTAAWAGRGGPAAFLRPAQPPGRLRCAGSAGCVAAGPPDRRGPLCAHRQVLGGAGAAPYQRPAEQAGAGRPVWAGPSWWRRWWGRRGLHGSCGRWGHCGGRCWRRCRVARCGGGAWGPQPGRTPARAGGGGGSSGSSVARLVAPPRALPHAVPAAHDHAPGAANGAQGRAACGGGGAGRAPGGAVAGGAGWPGASKRWCWWRC